MARLCRLSPLPIARLMRSSSASTTLCRIERLPDEIRPAFLALKPSLHGGMRGCREWIRLARERGIGSWITSTLESNVGLNAIAHLRAEGSICISHHAAGPRLTGLLYTDNVASPLVLRGDGMWFDEAAMGQEGRPAMLTLDEFLA